MAFTSKNIFINFMYKVGGRRAVRARPGRCRSARPVIAVPAPHQSELMDAARQRCERAAGLVGIG